MAPTIQPWCTISGCTHVASTATVMPVTPAITLRRAVFGSFHPIQREDEQRRREDGGELTDQMHHCFLNILSMRR